MMPRQPHDVGGIGVFPEKLEAAQQLLLDTVWQGYQQAEEWPKYFYVEAVLDQHDLDAEQVIASLPVIGGRLSGSSSYGLVRPTFVGPTRPQAGAPVPLTLAGLSYVAGASAVVQRYFALLDVMALARRRAVFDPVHETVVGPVEALSRPSRPVRRLLELADQWSPVAVDDLPPPPSYRTVRQMSPTDVDELVRNWEAGIGVVQLAKQFSVHRHTVWRHLQARGIDTTEKLSEEELTEAASLYMEGWSLARLGDRYGISDGTVRTRLIEAGVTMRKPWEKRALH